MTYKSYLVYVRCEYCNKWELVGHHDYFGFANERKKELIKSFGACRVKIECKSQKV